MKHVFLTGIPGVGKTTLVKKVCEAVVSSGVTVNGFYTEEVRERGRRVGFDVVTVSGERGRLSRVRYFLCLSLSMRQSLLVCMLFQSSTNTLSDSSAESTTDRREYRVGQYAVDLQSFESVALPLFRDMREGNRRVFVIDEIGKMELFSQPFIRAVRHTLDSSSCSILGTIPVPKGKPLALVEEVRSRQDVKIFMVTKENRERIFDDIVSALKECLK
ncbi:cancer-related nucleoside-triphosphatase isoform X1 [Myxocyprinus asiaticus]|uniref:cancer-related nucleoside-triphosphatase isoform X1 n=1 Tax=Myxocyprinus asiaticus TaxID=70543 RepID=UPI00222384A1|nr:cancer-related nucleoside-triphosphatase isoform X1 [Myxocyprinus asiaticus]